MGWGGGGGGGWIKTCLIFDKNLVQTPRDPSDHHRKYNLNIAQWVTLDMVT